MADAKSTPSYFLRPTYIGIIFVMMLQGWKVSWLMIQLPFEKASSLIYYNAIVELIDDNEGMKFQKPSFAIFGAYNILGNWWHI